MLSVLESLQLLVLLHVRESNNAATGLAYTEEEKAQYKHSTYVQSRFMKIIANVYLILLYHKYAFICNVSS